LNLNHKLDLKGLINKKNQIKKIFFYRICGTGMGAAACLLRECGYDVEGGDLNFFPPMSTYLEKTGIPLHNLADFDWDKLKEFDLIVVGNVVPRNGEDARRLEEIGTPFCSFPAVMGAFVLHDKNVVGIAGTHGKTTTTYFMSQVFKALGHDPGYFIGGVLEGENSSYLGQSPYFFIESDEYDSAYFEKISKFRSYTLNHLILTSLEFDHADIFTDIEDIKKEFHPVLEELKGVAIANSDYAAVEDLMVQFSNCHWHRYGSRSDFGPRKITQSHAGSEFEVRYENQWFQFKTNVVGEHNILNLTTCILFALSEGHEVGAVQEAVKNLEFVKRRQELRGLYQGAPVIDDFAHHPRSVDCTIAAVKTKYPDKKIKVILEPNSATARSNIFQDEFAAALLGADEVVFAKPERATTVKSAENLDYEQIALFLKQKGRSAVICDSLEGLREKINEIANEESLLLVLSNGTCLGLWKSSFVDELQ